MARLRADAAGRRRRAGRQNLKTNAEIRAPRGRDPLITSDNHFVVFAIAPLRKDVDQARKAKKKPEDMPKSGVGIVNLANGQATTVAEHVKSFRVPDETPQVVVFLTAPTAPAAPAEGGPTAPKTREKKAIGRAASSPCRSADSSRAVLRCGSASSRTETRETSPCPNNGEKHGLRQRENQKHWTVHMAEYFDYFFKDAPKPEWMEKGVPYLEKGKRDVSGFYKKSTDGSQRD
jgi:hypothetical protein